MVLPLTNNPKVPMFFLLLLFHLKILTSFELDSRLIFYSWPLYCSFVFVCHVYFFVFFFLPPLSTSMQFESNWPGLVCVESYFLFCCCCCCWSACRCVSAPRLWGFLSKWFNFLFCFFYTFWLLIGFLCPAIMNDGLKLLLLRSYIVETLHTSPPPFSLIFFFFFLFGF